MITTRGKVHILRYLAGLEMSVADTILIGVGATAATANDVRLDHEFQRLRIESITADTANGKLVFKTTMPPEIAGSVYEIGLLKSSSSDIENTYNRLITTFETTSPWVNGTLSASGRANNNQLRVSNATANKAVNLDFSGYANNDRFNLACSTTSNTTARIRFGQNASNYFEATVTINAGYQILRWIKSSMTATGSPTWSNIQYMGLVTTGTVDFDSLRIEQTNILDNTHVLISRNVLSSPEVKSAGSSLEIETGINIQWL